MHVRDNKILGTVQTPVLDRNAKAAYLAHYCKQNGIDPNDVATIGDGANDLAMLQAAGMGVAFEGKPCCWPNWQSNLTTLIFAAF